MNIQKHNRQQKSMPIELAGQGLNYLTFCTPTKEYTLRIL